MAARAEQLVPHLQRLAADASPASDAELLERFVRDRDEAAFGGIVERHGPMVLLVCRRLLADADAAEDCLQATFLVLARRAVSIRRREVAGRVPARGRLPCSAQGPNGRLSAAARGKLWLKLLTRAPTHSLN